MPVNDWDYLMGDKIQQGHSAESYTLHDPTDIVQEYHRFLASHLSLSEPNKLGLSQEQADVASLTQTISILNDVILKQNCLIDQLRLQLASVPAPS